MKTKILITGLALLLFPFIMSGQTKWQETTGSVTFKIKNAGITVTGRFSDMKTSLIFSPDNLATSSLKGSVSVGTLKTGIDKRDKDLKDEKYFDEGKYKLIEIASTKLYNKGTGYAGLFNVTIKGVTKQVEIPFVFSTNGNNAEFKGDFTINRRDFGVGEKSMMMADDVNISIDANGKTDK